MPGQGAFYRLDPDYRVTRVVEEVTLSNGLDWSLDNRLMYYVDSTSQQIDTFPFDLETGALGVRSTAITIPKNEGLPDGMTVDAEGGIWVALHGSGTVRRYLPDGTLDRSSSSPCAWSPAPRSAAPDYEDLYITTMNYGMTPDALATSR